jgi:hypothetical protein
MEVEEKVGPSTWAQVRESREAIRRDFDVLGDKFTCAGATGYEAFCLALSGAPAPAYTYRGGGYCLRASLVTCLLGVAPQSFGARRSLTRDDGTLVADWDAELAGIGMEAIPAAPAPATVETAAEKAARLARLRAGFVATVAAHGNVVVEPPLPVFIRLLPDGEVLEVSVRWPDERGPQPPIGTRVKVSQRGEIEIEEPAPLGGRLDSTVYVLE